MDGVRREKGRGGEGGREGERGGRKKEMRAREKAGEEEET